ncbi:transposase [Paraburkholderia guartelaensis]|uniref:transposase n=1 Tax=Paraburkholderia guartelaensis TaxID=2546446 RepID=UPI002AB75378|nr:transposase [Paraburkholderia guartelaensis]
MSNAAGRAHPHRTYAREFKQQVIRETLEPGMSVSIVARRHDINANEIFGWRKQYREGKLVVPALGVAASVPSTELLAST